MPIRKPLLTKSLLLFSVVFLFAALDQYPYLSEQFSRGQPFGRDFYNLWTAGRILLETGSTASVYNNAEFTLFQQIKIGEGIGWNSYLYPPQGLLLAASVAYFPYIPAFLIYSLLGITTVLLALLPGTQDKQYAILFFLLAPMTIINLIMGQSGLIGAALLIGGLRLLGHKKHHKILAGILFGLLTFKPIIGILIPILLLCRRDWLTFFTATIVTIALCVLPSIFWGIEVWQHFYNDAIPNQKSILHNAVGIGMLMISSAFNSGRILGFSLDISYLLHLTFAAMALTIAINYFWKQRPSKQSIAAPLNEKGLLIFTLGTALMSPYLHNYDLTMLEVVVILYCLQCLSIHSINRKHIIMIGLCWTVAFCTPLINLLGLPIAPVLLLIALLIASQENGKILNKISV